MPKPSKVYIAKLGHPVVHLSVDTKPNYFYGRTGLVIAVSRSGRVWQHRGQVYIEAPATCTYGSTTVACDVRDILVWDGIGLSSWVPCV